MNKSDDPNAPKNQAIEHAPHEGRNDRGDIVADATESAGQDSAWEASGDLEPRAVAAPPLSNEEGYSSGPDNFAEQVQGPSNP